MERLRIAFFEKTLSRVQDELEEEQEKYRREREKRKNSRKQKGMAKLLRRKIGKEIQRRKRSKLS